MAECNDRIVYPDEVEEVKEAAAKKVEPEGNNSIETPEPVTPQLTTRNIITVPSNCPPGFVKGIDGVCREVFD